MSTLSLSHQEMKTKLQQSNYSKDQLWNIVEEYFRYYTAQGVKDEIWMLTVSILSSDQAPEVETGNDRNNLLHFYEHSILFIEAINQLTQLQQKKRRKRKSKP